MRTRGGGGWGVVEGGGERGGDGAVAEWNRWYFQTKNVRRYEMPLS